MKNCRKENIYLHRESGAVLIVGLIMVLLISIIGLSAIRSSNLQEAMAGNMRDRNVAFQAAESALVVGEAEVNVFAPIAPTCTGQLTCFLRSVQPYQAPQNSVVYLEGAQFNAIARESGLVLASVGTPPTFIIEELAEFIPAEGSGLEIGGGGGLTKLVPYRITAQGTGLGPNASVILQTTYNRFAE
jgi:type IV pilus assembly protein PilX